MAKKQERLTAELKLRVPEALRKKIEEAAKARDRDQSLNTEIIERLSFTFRNVLLEELLTMQWGEATGQIAAHAAYGGLLNLSDENKEAILQNVRRLLEEVQKGRKFK